MRKNLLKVLKTLRALAMTRGKKNLLLLSCQKLCLFIQCRLLLLKSILLGT